MAVIGQIDFIQIIQNAGVMGSMVFLLIWINWKRDIARDALVANRESRVAADNRAREERMAVRVSVLETFVNEELLKLIHDGHKLINENSCAFKALTDALLKKPCLMVQDKN